MFDSTSMSSNFSGRSIIHKSSLAISTSSTSTLNISILGISGFFASTLGTSLPGIWTLCTSTFNKSSLDISISGKKTGKKTITQTSTSPSTSIPNKSTLGINTLDANHCNKRNTNIIIPNISTFIIRSPNNVNKTSLLALLALIKFSYRELKKLPK